MLHSFFFYSYGDHRDLHSFPTRRSSDLAPEVLRGSSNKYQNWELVDPEKWVPDGYACVRSTRARSEEHTSELQSHSDLVCRLLLEKKKKENQRKDSQKGIDEGGQDSASQ